MKEEQKKQMNAKFMRSDFELIENEEIILPVSMDNPSVSEQALRDILNLIVEEKEKIKTFTIVIADALKRHYVKEGDKEEITLQFGKDWLFRNKKFLDDFTRKVEGKIELKITYWKEYLADPEYQSKLALVQELYQNNEQFKVRVNQLANLYKKQGDSLTYLLEEIAVLGLWHGTLIYPKAKLDKPLDFFLKNYCKELRYLGYFFPRKSSNLEFFNNNQQNVPSFKNSDPLSKAIQLCTDFNDKMKDLGIATTDQKKIIDEFLEMTTRLESLNIGATNGFRNQIVN